MFLKKCAVTVFTVLTVSVLSTASYAAEYLFKLREDTVALCDESAELMTEECFDDDSALARIGGVYTTDDISIIEKYREMGLLEYYEENAPAYLFDMPATNEYMTALVSGYVPIGESLAQLNVNEFWKLGLSGKGITVGVIDSGVSAHSALKDNLLSGYNTYDDNYETSDVYGHGTTVSGFIAGNGTAYMGTAYNAKIIPLKAFSDSGSGDVYTMADGIYKAIELGCDVINMSCGSLSDNSTLRYAVKHAVDNGVIIIAASGNVNGEKYGTKTVGSYDSHMYPACYNGVVSVGNIDRYGSLSNTSIENDYVDVVANGKYVTGLSNTALSGYRGGSGTSFACPIVTGIVACMLEAKPDLTPAQIETMLQQTATDLGNTGKDFSYGYGKVNCAALVPCLLDGKIYRSNMVLYKNTYNVAVRNGLAESFGAFSVLANYNGNKMIAIETDNFSLVQGESKVITISAGGTSTKMFFLNPSGYAPVLGK